MKRLVALHSQSHLKRINTQHNLTAQGIQISHRPFDSMMGCLTRKPSAV